MTLEEKAENYCNHLQSEMLAYTPENPRHQRTVTLLHVEDAYIAGAKENGIKWHNLKENPDDLPKEYDIIRKAFGVYEEETAPHIVLDQEGNKVYCVRTIGNHQKVWNWVYEDEELGVVEYEVTHWCEIPKFKE